MKMFSIQVNFNKMREKKENCKLLSNLCIVNCIFFSHIVRQHACIQKYNLKIEILQRTTNILNTI